MDQLRETLPALLEGLDAGDAAAVLAVLTPDAVWESFGFPISIPDPLPGDLAFFAAALGLGPEAIGAELIAAEIALRGALRTAHRVACPAEDLPDLRCRLTTTNALTELTGLSETGSLVLTPGPDGRIARVRFETEQVAGRAAPDLDAFRRWSAVEEPGVARQLSVDQLRLTVEALDRWLAAGRPDLELPDVTADPIEVVAAFLDARNDRDWTLHMRLLGGDALENPFGSRDEFDAAAALERRITAVSCEVTLTSERQGSFVACEVTVSDIITEAAGVNPTNPNATTFRVREGRVIDLPEFLPSLFLAEEAIEEWALDNEPDDYALACPFGIAGQDVIDGLACALFIAEHRESWAPGVGLAY